VEAKRQGNRDAAIAKILEAAALKREQVCVFSFLEIDFKGAKMTTTKRTIVERFQSLVARTRLASFLLSRHSWTCTDTISHFGNKNRLETLTPTGQARRRDGH